MRQRDELIEKLLQNIKDKFGERTGNMDIDQGHHRIRAIYLYMACLQKFSDRHGQKNCKRSKITS